MTTTLKKKASKSTNYFPSINIARDYDVDINYIPTPNSLQAYNQISNDYKVGTKVFNIIGAYGTGKSAFILAFEKTLRNEASYFPAGNIFENISKIETINIVGEYASIIEEFAHKFNIKTNKETKPSDIIQGVEKYYNKLKKQNKALILVIDEFGKFLEYASKYDPDRELYFIQQLAEYINNIDKDIVLLTTLHQDFNGYSRDLTKSQKNEWDKVKGRFKEVTFNEPVEQLLYLASERLEQIKLAEYKDINSDKVFNSIANANLFPLKDYFTEAFAQKLLPFDILSASILTVALQKYGQNERSLFSFIESNDLHGVRDFNPSQSPYYNLASVYDYLIHNYYSFLTTKYNPHYSQWAAIRSALERTEGVMQENIKEAQMLIKTIGLLNILAPNSAKIDEEFLNEYGKYSLGIKQPQILIKELNKFKIIKLVHHRQRYILFEGTDLDIELAIDEAGNVVEQVSNIVYHLKKYFDFPYIPAKAASYKVGTPRFFEFILSETPKALIPEREVDGFINLIFSDVIREDDVKTASSEQNEAILYGFYRNSSEIKKLLFEIEKIKKVKQQNPEDKVAQKELEGIYQHYVSLLNHYVLGSLYSSQSPVSWYFKGKEVKVTSLKDFNRLLSRICEEVYNSCPIYKNEMVNKTKLSPIISTSRKYFVKTMIENWGEKNWAFEEGKFPPEKTIYLSLVRETGIHVKNADKYDFAAPSDESFKALWNECENFLESTRGGKRSVKELYDKLLARPFKLKQGFLDYWTNLYLFIKRDEYALFSENGFIPQITAEIFDLLVKNPQEFEVKAFDIEGVKLNIFNSYRTFLDQKEEESLSANSFIETIRPFLVFYKDLPEYVKQTKRLPKKAAKLRDAIAYSKDPERTFFEDFPNAMSFSINELQKNKKSLGEYVSELQAALKEIRTFYDNLLSRVEEFINEEIVGETLVFPDYRIALKERYSKIKKHLLLPHQKVLIQRINSELDDKKAWLNSIAQATIGKTFEAITDEEEVLFYEKLKDYIHELDNLNDISKSGFDETKEIAFKLEVTSFVEGLKKNLVRLPKSKNKELVQLHGVLKTKLSNDKQLNIASLAKLLEDLLNDR